ncbi:FecR domain-containing protein [Neptuniibacter caesariensis]|uniref:LysM motif protein n=1 Tax=Neptuniibacter caesariensis TaxID=207954 RepID=A0A7U8GSF3_NEPCE|nr:FecR domain-containing protein [Neptuniibacter caesariensis]EAR61015.1 LysM motif protein [Neptuniibacter caesariensis]
MDVSIRNALLFSTFFILSVMAPQQLQAQEWVYSVVDGDTLSEFSEKHLKKTSYWKQLQKINNVADPKRIPVNTKLRIPLAWIKSEPATAEIVDIQGRVKIRTAKSPEEQFAQIGDKLSLGDELTTLNNASAMIRFADASEVVIQQSTHISFNHLSKYGETGMVDSRVRLISGNVETQAQPQVGSGARLEIHTPSAITAVRGTEFRTTYSTEKGSARIEVLEGRVKVSGANKTRLIRSGYGTKVEKNKAPLKPRKLLPAPEVAAIPEPIEQVGYELFWQKVPSSAAYRVLISKDNVFGTVLWDNIADRNRLNLPDYPDGEYQLQIRAIDKLGIEGMPSFTQFRLNAHPQPPFPMAPPQKAIIRGENPLLEWTRSADAETYRLEVATDPHFANKVIDKNRVADIRFATDQLRPEKTYYWRLASFAPDGELGPYSDVREFDVKPIPATPETSVLEGDTNVSLSWSEGKQGQTYQIQVARDRAFDNILTDTTVREAKLDLPRPEGYRYVRVRTLAEDGYAGAWGTTQELSPPPSDSWIYIFGSAVMTILLL